MQHTTFARYCLAFSLSLHLGFGAATPAVGSATSNSRFQVDAASVSGHATLFEGNVISTGSAASEVQLNNGGRLVLAANSRGAVYGERFVLEKGEARLLDGPVSIHSGAYRFVPLGKGSRLTVALAGPSAARVSMESGKAVVEGGKGGQIASLEQGQAVVFDWSKAGGSLSAKLTGKLVKSNGHYLITDELSKITSEVKGSGFDGSLDKRVTVEGIILLGSKPAPGATMILTVSSLKAAAAGLSTGSVVLGVVIASTAATGASLGLARGESDQTSTSR